MVDLIFELIHRLPTAIQRVIAVSLAAAIFMFLVALVYLYFTNNLW